MRESGRARLRAGDANVDAVACVVTFAVAFDFATTTTILLDPTLDEGNAVLAALASVHVSLALAVNLGYGAPLLGTYVLVTGWIGRVGAAMAFPSIALGVNNVLYALDGDTSMLAVAFGEHVHAALAYGIPAFGFVVGSAWHVARERSLPWPTVAATAFLVGGVVLVASIVV